MKRTVILLICSVFLLMAAIPSVNAAQKLKIGVVTILANPDLNLLKDEFLKKMGEKGYEVEHTYFNADSQKYPGTFAQRGAEAAAKMVADGAQLIYATGIYLPIHGAVGDVPIIDPSLFVTPATAQAFTNKDGKFYCKGNGTGTYLTYPFPEVIKFVTESTPNAKKVAYIYNPNSPVSRPINDIESEAKKAGLTVVSCPFTSKEEAIQALEKAKAGADVAFATNDIAVVNAHMEAIAFMKEKKFPVILAIVPLVNAGAFAALQADWKRAAEMCADKAEMILKGTKANSIPVEKPDKFEIGLNLKTAEQIGITGIPYEWMELATMRVE